MSDSTPFRLIAPKITPVLDPLFRPAVLANRAFRKSLKEAGQSQPVIVAIEQADGSIFHFNTEMAAGDSEAAVEANFFYLERFIKFILWSRGGYRVYVTGPASLIKKLQNYYVETANGQFDADIMGNRIYEKPFEIVQATPGTVPAPYEATKPLGRHLDGCRIGFDLGASDRKAAAVLDGEVVFSDETPWDPSKQSDPSYHYDGISDSLKKAAANLPRVDAIGGSSAGVYVNNRAKVASLFRSVPKDLFDAKIKDIFLNLRKEWNNIPFEVANDGEVTALAGSMSLKDNGVLGIALGSSQAVGYVTLEGNITSWLNELAFVPVDYRPEGPADEWSGDRGCGVQYFSQQCVSRLLAPAGIEADLAMPAPERLKVVQALMQEGDYRAEKIYQTIGTYLGYAIAHYVDFYDVKHVLILGRVTTGDGGAVIINGAKEVLKAEFPDLAEKVNFTTPDERDKRHGQAIAAASLPVIESTSRNNP
ncbi:MAG: ROK family protein [Armatimonadetes bacterium]|nr:ROK family protein [Armatimonadota bacterium]